MCFDFFFGKKSDKKQTDSTEDQISSWTYCTNTRPPREGDHITVVELIFKDLKMSSDQLTHPV